MIESVNILSVLVTTLLAVAIANVWFSPIFFGRVMTQSFEGSTGINEEKIHSIQVVIYSLIAYFLFFYILAESISFVRMYEISHKYLVVLFAGVIVASIAGVCIRSRQSFVYMCIHIVYALTILFGGTAVIAFWPW